MTEREDSVQRLLFQVMHSYLTKSFVQAGKMGIHPGQMPVLGLLEEKDGISQSTVCKRLGIKPSTVTVSLKRLEKMEMVRRVPDQKDQRVVRVYLTEKARQTVRETKEVLKQNEKMMLKGLSETEICLLKRLLEQIASNLRVLPGDETMMPAMCKREESQR